jgi:hypothetical protein
MFGWDERDWREVYGVDERSVGRWMDGLLSPEVVFWRWPRSVCLDVPGAGPVLGGFVAGKVAGHDGDLVGFPVWVVWLWTGEDGGCREAADAVGGQC